MKTNDVRIKVVKNSGDFERAMKCGFAVNIFECSDDQMWLVMPNTFTHEQLVKAAKENNFKVIG